YLPNQSQLRPLNSIGRNGIDPAQEYHAERLAAIAGSDTVASRLFRKLRSNLQSAVQSSLRETPILAKENDLPKEQQWRSPNFASRMNGARSATATTSLKKEWPTALVTRFIKRPSRGTSAGCDAGSAGTCTWTGTSALRL